MKINILPFIVESMGDNEIIYNDIDETYIKNRYVFYKAAKNHPLYNHQIVKEGSLIQEEYRKKILGILLIGQSDNNTTEEIEKLIKKGYRYTYVYVKNHSRIYLNDYIKSFIKKHKNKERKLNEKLEQSIPILMLLVLNSPNKLVEDELFSVYISLLSKRWLHYNDSEKTRISLDKATPKDKEKIEKLKESIYKKYGEIRNFNDLVEKESKLPSIQMSALIFDYEKLSSISVLENIPFSDKDIDEILYIYIIGKKDLKDIETALDFLISYMHIKYLIKAYKDVKTMYFKNNKETMFVELEALELELKKANKKIYAKEKDMEEIVKKLEILKKENTRLKKQLREERKQKSELNGLREFVFNLDKEVEYKDTAEINYELLRNHKAVIIGGHERWQQKMKKFLPNFIFIHSDMLNFDTNIFNNIDTVFIFINYLSHGMYYKVIETIRGKDIEIVYITKQNHKKVLKIIQEKI